MEKTINDGVGFDRHSIEDIKVFTSGDPTMKIV